MRISGLNREYKMSKENKKNSTLDELPSIEALFSPFFKGDQNVSGNLPSKPYEKVVHGMMVGSYMKAHGHFVENIGQILEMFQQDSLDAETILRQFFEDRKKVQDMWNDFKRGPEL